MQNYNELINLTDRQIQLLLKSIELTTLLRALKGSTQEFIQKVLNNVSKLAFETITTELKKMQNTPVQLIQQAKSILISKANHIKKNEE